MKTKVKQDEFLAKIIHDLKTPAIAQINALESFLDTSSDKINSEEKELIELTLNSCNYMQKLIDTFYSVHRLNYENIKPVYKCFDLREVIANTLINYNILLKYSNLNFETTGEKEAIINADEMQLKIVVENLISYSINSAFKNSTIVLNLKKTKSDIIFEIKTQSPFIEQENLKDIFENLDSQKFNNTADSLGLYLSKEIIHAHFGRMIAKSFEDNINILGFGLPIK
jgi:K+-sensing histidine kinase KdpD